MKNILLRELPIPLAAIAILLVIFLAGSSIALADRTTVVTTTTTSSSYPFALTGNATSTLTQFNGGLTAFASSTIGNGTGAGGLTINGSATTTGAAFFTSSVSIGTADVTFQLEAIKSTVGTTKVLFQNTDAATNDGEQLFLGTRSNVGDTNVGIGIKALRTNAGSSGDNDLILSNSAGTVALDNLTIKANRNVGIATSSAFARLSVQANPTDPVIQTMLFAIGSSTASATTTLFAVDNTGTVFTGKGSAASSTEVVNGKYQKDTFNTTGSAVCLFIVGTTPTVSSGACNR